MHLTLSIIKKEKYIIWLSIHGMNWAEEVGEEDHLEGIWKEYVESLGILRDPENENMPGILMR